MASGAPKDIEDALFPNKNVAYTTGIDLNTTGTTDVYDPSTEALVHGVYMRNGGGTAVVRLEVTDGTNTAVLTPGQSGGEGIAFGDTIALDSGQKLQVNVTTAEGSSQTNDAVVSRGE